MLFSQITQFSIGQKTMGQTYRKVGTAKIEASGQLSSAVNMDGMVFGKIEIRATKGSVPSARSFQLKGSFDNSYFENAKDNKNAEIADLAFSASNKIFNLSVEQSTFKHGKIELDAALDASTELEIDFYMYTNDNG